MSDALKAREALRNHCEQLLDIIDNYDINHEAVDEDIEVVEAARAALSALDQPSGVRVGVKPLEWRLIDDDHWAAETPTRLIYEVRQGRASVRIRFPGQWGFEPFDGDIEAAKAVAQADFDARILSALDLSAIGAEGSFQSRVQPWMMACFGPAISADKLERSDRFIEEALELAQAADYPKERALALVDYVYGRPAGDLSQESGGVSVTHAALCLAHDIDMAEAAERELARIWTKIEKIRAKQAAKPTGSALPIPAPPSPPEPRS